MDIKLTTGVEPMTRAWVSPSRTRPVAPDSETAAFDSSTALDAGLDATPDTRTEAVTKAAVLVQDADYPPPETIRKIANLLAMNFDSKGASTADANQ